MTFLTTRSVQHEPRYQQGNLHTPGPSLQPVVSEPLTTNRIIRTISTGQLSVFGCHLRWAVVRTYLGDVLNELLDLDTSLDFFASYS
jgi:hypothetical protein